MPKLRTLIAAGILTLAASLLVGVSPANAAGNYKCDTNSPQWNVTMCVRTDADFQSDGSGWKNLTVRTIATGSTGTLEDCPEYSATIYLKRGDGTVIESRAGTSCFDSKTWDFDAKFGNNAYVVVYVQMFDNGAVDPPLAKISLAVVD